MPSVLQSYLVHIRQHVRKIRCSNVQREDDSNVSLLGNDKHILERRRGRIIKMSVVLSCIMSIIVGYSSYHRIYNLSNKKIIPKIRIAHCMTGLPRTLYNEEVYTAYRTNALDALPGDLFIVFQSKDQKDDIHGALVEAPSPSSYQYALAYLKPLVITWIPADENLGARDDTSGYAKWKRCLDLIKDVEKQNGTKYDFIVRTRPDLLIAKALPSATMLPKDRVLINPYYECFDDMPPGYHVRWPNMGQRCDSSGLGVSDIFAIVPRALADIYMDVAYEPNLPIGVCGARFNHAECRVKAVLHKYNVTYELWPFVVKIMRPAEFCHKGDWNKFNSWC